MTSIQLWSNVSWIDLESWTVSLHHCLKRPHYFLLHSNFAIFTTVKNHYIIIIVDVAASDCSKLNLPIQCSSADVVVSDSPLHNNTLSLLLLLLILLLLWFHFLAVHRMFVVHGQSLESVHTFLTTIRHCEKSEIVKITIYMLFVYSD